MPNHTFDAIDPCHLERVAGGASRVSARSSGNEQLTTMLTQVTSSIKDLATQNKGGMDPMMMMMMMSMMGAGGSAAAAPAAPPPLPQINVSVR